MPFIAPLSPPKLTVPNESARYNGTMVKLPPPDEMRSADAVPEKATSTTADAKHAVLAKFVFILAPQGIRQRNCRRICDNGPFMQYAGHATISDYVQRLVQYRTGCEFDNVRNIDIWFSCLSGRLQPIEVSRSYVRKLRIRAMGDNARLTSLSSRPCTLHPLLQSSHPAQSRP